MEKNKTPLGYQPILWVMVIVSSIVCLCFICIQPPDNYLDGHWECGAYGYTEECYMDFNELFDIVTVCEQKQVCVGKDVWTRTGD